MPEFIVTLKATAEVVGSVRVEANDEAEAIDKAREKAEKDYITWANPMVDQSTLTTFKIFGVSKKA